MAKSFFAIQAAETRKMWAMAVVIFAVYFAFFFLLTLGVTALFESDRTGLVIKALVYGSVLALAILAIQLWYADRYGVQVILDGLSAQDPDPEDTYHQRLVRVTEELRVSAGGARVKPMVVPTLACNAFALADSRRAVIGVTEGVISRLSREQTQAVVAHEMAHIVNQDCRLATWVCAMGAPFLALAEWLEKMDEQPGLESWEDRTGEESNALMPAAAGATIRSIVDLLTVALSRRREQRADAKAIELTRNPQAMAEAIYRIAHADHLVGGPAESLSPIFILPSRMRPVDEREGLFADLFSGHPPIRTRLKLLVDMAHTDLDEVARNARSRPAAAPIAGLDEQLVETQQYMLRTGGEWTGPFVLAQLARQVGFGPQSWVRPYGDEGEGMPACNDPLINRFFRVRQKAADPTAGACPGCCGALERTTYEGIPVGRCSRCKGLLVGEGRVRRILARHEVSFGDDFQREVDAWLEENYVARDPTALEPSAPSDSCICPLCRQSMQRRPYSYQHFVPIDICHICHQIWFDHKELEMLQVLVERGQERRARRSGLQAAGLAS